MLKTIFALVFLLGAGSALADCQYVWVVSPDGGGRYVWVCDDGPNEPSCRYIWAVEPDGTGSYVWVCT